jgi:hypothetical protein
MSLSVAESISPRELDTVFEFGIHADISMPSEVIAALKKTLALASAGPS